MVGWESRGEVDRLLAAVQDDRNDVATALVAMDTEDGGLAYLRTVSPTGVTLAAWQRTSARIDALWAGFHALGTALDAAAALRARGPRPARARLAEITGLLLAPPGDDTLPDPYRATTVVQLGHLLAADCQQVRATLADVDAHVAAVNARFGVIESALAAAAQAPDAPLPELDRYAAEVRDLRADAARDPLGTDLDSRRLRTVSAAVEALTALAALRSGYPGRRAALGEAVTALADAEGAARDAYARATTKIHDPRLPAAVDSEPALRRRVAALDRLDLAALDQALPALEQAVAAALASAGERRQFADGLLARRDELRGRLEAYRMKAVRTGRSEQDHVLAGYATAQALLWTAPCDLPAATRAVVAFQRSLHHSPGGGAA